jgi:hypothetical protein
VIQFNLLPSVKLEYIKARRIKRLVIMTSSIVTGLALAIVIMLFVGTSILQRQHLENLQKDIDRDSKTLQNTPELNKILTIQNQLKSVNGLHDEKPVADRLGVYLPQLTPNLLTIATLDVDFTENTIEFEGAAPGIDVVNKFTDTLKFTAYKSDDGEGPAFSEVVLSDFSRTESKATYNVKLKFNPIIFNGAHTVQLEVPKIISTRSTTEKPNALFKAIESTGGGQ